MIFSIYNVKIYNLQCGSSLDHVIKVVNNSDHYYVGLEDLPMLLSLLNDKAFSFVCPFYQS